jgi:hypothetical protein
MMGALGAVREMLRAKGSDVAAPTAPAIPGAGSTGALK